MSIDRCKNCEALIDTDSYPESYRKEFNDVCLCQECYEDRLDDEMREAEGDSP